MRAIKQIEESYTGTRCVKVGMTIMINSISAVDAIKVNNRVYSEEKKVTNPIISQKTELNSDKGALRSYFLGGISFGGHNCSTSNFALKKIADVPCCCCGDIMLRKQDIYKHEQRLIGPKGNDLVEVIKEEEKYLRTAERTAAFMIAEAVKGTDKDFAAGIQETNKNLPKYFDKYCKSVLGETYVKSVELAGYDAPVSKYIQETIKGIEQGDKFDRIQFTGTLQGLKGDLTEEEYGKIENTAMNLPENQSAVGSIYKKYSEKPGAFAHRLFSTAMTTAEHVTPKSLGGPNNTANYLAECAGCNNPRGNMSYSQWLKVHPEYPRMVQDHIEHVEMRIVNGELPQNYDIYPTDIKKTLSKESNGVMELVVLSADKLRELRDAKKSGQEVDIRKETEALEKQLEESEKA